MFFHVCVCVCVCVCSWVCVCVHGCMVLRYLWCGVGCQAVMHHSLAWHAVLSHCHTELVWHRHVAC
jgi:hypothetical protein